MNLNVNLSTVLAQLNAEEAKKPAAKPKKQPAKAGKPPAGPKAALAGAGAPAAQATEDGGKIKLKLKGQVNGFAATKPSATANILAAASAAAATPLNPMSAPLGKRLKDVLDLVLARLGQQLSVAEIQQACGQDLSVDQQLVQELHKHPRVRHGPVSAAGAAAEWYSYRPEIEGINDKVALLNYVRDARGRPVLAEALRKCYAGAAEDLQALKQQRKVFIIAHPEPEKETVFECDMMGMESVPEDVQGLWLEVRQEHIKDHLPEDLFDLQNAVVKAGLRSALANQPVKRSAQVTGPRERQKKPRQQRINIEKATNAHLPQLFAGAQPKMLDA